MFVCRRCALQQRVAFDQPNFYPNACPSLQQNLRPGFDSRRRRPYDWVLNNLFMIAYAILLSEKQPQRLHLCCMVNKHMGAHISIVQNSNTASFPKTLNWLPFFIPENARVAKFMNAPFLISILTKIYVTSIGIIC